MWERSLNLLVSFRLKNYAAQVLGNSYSVMEKALSENYGIGYNENYIVSSAEHIVEKPLLPDNLVYQLDCWWVNRVVRLAPDNPFLFYLVIGLS